MLSLRESILISNFTPGNHCLIEKSQENSLESFNLISLVYKFETPNLVKEGTSYKTTLHSGTRIPIGQEFLE